MAEILFSCSLFLLLINLLFQRWSLKTKRKVADYVQFTIFHTGQSLDISASNYRPRHSLVGLNVIAGRPTRNSVLVATNQQSNRPTLILQGDLRSLPLLKLDVIIADNQKFNQSLFHLIVTIFYLAPVLLLLHLHHNQMDTEGGVVI